MTLRVFGTTVALTSAPVLVASVSLTLAEENIIQEEKISFEKCLEVISVSENKLSISPEINQELDQKRIATFYLADGTLTITCDGVKGLVIVSTNMN